MLTLAYGEFDSTTFWGMFNETLPFFIRWVSVPAVLYVICSLLAELMKYKGVAIIIYLVVFGILTSSMALMGAYGPAHVAMEVGFWAWPLFFIAIVFKLIWLWRSDVGDRHRAAHSM